MSNVGKQGDFADPYMGYCLETIRLEPLVEDIFSYFRFNFAPGEVVHCELGEHV